MACEFIMQLSKLRKSSAESVENTNAFNHFKEYLHVERHVEIELRKLLRSVNEKQGKCLVLLCGSAGDGKSHLISYMKNSDTEGLLEGYELYNDATESSEPTLTSIDTLADKLTDFDDEHYDNADGSKMIIAINLGTLNNFIESAKGKPFTKLRKYVEENKILSSYAQETGYKDKSVFQHVSFADYQVFSLSFLARMMIIHSISLTKKRKQIVSYANAALFVIILNFCQIQRISKFLYIELSRRS